MAALERQSSFLPTIKCSSCGNQIEISMMGEHICGGSAEQPPMPPPPEKERLDTFMPFNKEVHEKIGRVPPPPKVDTLAANRTYYRAGQLTPVSNSSGTASRSESPLTPNARSLGGRSEDYFAPKIANEDEPTTQQPRQRRSGGYGGMNEFDEMYPADTAKKQAPNLLARMNSIAPGPFDAGRRPSAASRDPPPRRPSGDDRMGDMGNPYGERPQTSNTNANFGTSGGNQPRAPRSNGYGGFGPPQRSPDAFEPEPFGSRARTFPRENEPAGPLLRTPSEPGSRPDQQRMPSNDMYGRQPPMGPDTSRQPPPRTGSYKRPPTRDGSNAAPPDLTDEFGIGNPYHSPNSSLSSNGSSRPSQTSSQTSPSRSLRSRPTRKPSDTSSFDSLMQDLQSSMDDMASFGQNRDPPTPQDRTHERPRSSRNQSSTRRQNSRNDSYSQRAPSPIPSPGWDDSMDRGRDNRRPPSPRYSSPERAAERAPSRAPQRAQSGGRDSVPKSRGSCKACREPITGKSISSADGRLTGRYHKACFVCTTCRDPFASATFYVHDDMPYCEQHYHEMNGSLCGMCNIGIEGQYLADERDTKYHPPCFRCSDCGQILSDGYFEVGGRRYCERDAWRRTQPVPQPTNRIPMPSNLGPGSRRPPQGSLPGGPKGFPANRAMGGQPYGMPGGGNNRLGAPGSRPRMEKRMTRLGMM